MSDDGKLRTGIQWIGLPAGPLLAAVCFLLLPTEYSSADGQVLPFGVDGRTTLAVMVWMATWWLTEAVELSVTALLPLVLFPALGVASIGEAAAPYANPLIFLFLGGFLLAISMQRWGLGKRIALMTLRVVGTRPTFMIAGFMLITAVLSAFVSNTATAAMMLPIAISVIELVRQEAGSDEAGASQAGDNFALCLLLGIAYAASVGGVATIIGSPPNAILVGFLREEIVPEYRIDLSMARWLTFGVPLAVVFLPIVLFVLTKLLYPIRVERLDDVKQSLQGQLAALGPVNRGEWATFLVFLCAAGLWITRPWLVQWEAQLGSFRPFSGLHDAGIAILAALMLFVIPVDFRNRRFVMEWDATQQVPWGILILFGGGLSLASAVQSSGVAEFLGSQASYFAGLPPVVVVLVVCTGVIFLTELTSNTATAATLVPVLAALAPGLGVHPYMLVFPAAIAASFAFMLPVATPPNAIVFGSGRITIPQMAKAGIVLNVLGVLVVTALTMLLIRPLLGAN